MNEIEAELTLGFRRNIIKAINDAGIGGLIICDAKLCPEDMNFYAKIKRSDGRATEFVADNQLSVINQIIKMYSNGHRKSN